MEISSDFERILKQFAAARLQFRMLPPQHPKRQHLFHLMQGIENQARTYLSEGEIAQAEKLIQQEEQRLYEASLQLSQEQRIAKAIRDKDFVAREATKNMFGAKEGLDAEQFEKATAPGAKSVTFPTGRAHIDEQAMQKWASSINTKLGLEKNTPYKRTIEVLDAWDDTRTSNPDKYEQQLVQRGVDAEFLGEILPEWADTSLRFAWAERLNKRDDEKKVPYEEEVPISDADSRRLLITKLATEQTAKQVEKEAATGDETTADWWNDEIDPRIREEAAEEALRREMKAKRELETGESGPAIDHVPGLGMRHDIISAIDKLEAQEAENG